MKKRIPRFRSKEEAALFWENHEILDYVAADEFKVVDPRKSRRFSFRSKEARSRKELVSLRIDAQLLKKARELAIHRQTGYQAILRTWLEKGSPRR